MSRSQVEIPAVLEHAPPRASRSQAIAAVAILALTCLIWGASFPLAQFAMRGMSHALGAAPGHDLSPRLRLAASASYNGWRFALATIVYWLLTRRHQRNYCRAELTGGLCVGAFSAAGMLAQLIGLGYTLPSVSGFLTALPVVFAPLAQAMLLRRRVGGQTWLAVGLALAGIALLCRLDPASFTGRALALAPPVPYLGEALTILAAMFFTAQIMGVDRYGTTAHPARLTCLILLTACVLNLGAGAALAPREIYSVPVFRRLMGDWVFLGCLLGMATFCSSLALHWMNVHQPRIAPATAAVVYCLEPLFATLFSVALRTEPFTVTTVAGGAVIVAAVLVVAHAMRNHGQLAIDHR